MKTDYPFNKAVSLLATVIATTLAATASAAADGRNALNGPLVIKEQGSFFVDGESVFAEHPIGEVSGPLVDLIGAPGHITVNQMYVEFQIPQSAGRHVPVVLIHGGDLRGGHSLSDVQGSNREHLHRR